LSIASLDRFCYETGSKTLCIIGSIPDDWLVCDAHGGLSWMDSSKVKTVDQGASKNVSRLPFKSRG
ncbi:MAG: hypothetical protein ACKOAH_09630, partial [Pirellula sp.]